ncbi:WD repeat-containing protein 25-like [Mytilus californianus]|uniref:WD repeat-containing protein 25-like n=1 Tax=Mytilus californianus TaxID=6549 RepID=UPI0022483D55|nr:WD repeat-containing protein 25-like [Mytilus californianus]
MEALKNYDDDSDDSYSDDYKDNFQTKNCGERIKDDGLSIIKDSSRVYVQKLKHDFFNLQESDSDHEPETKSKIRKKENIEIIVSSGDTITVPEGCFWEPLPTEVKQSNDFDINQSIEKECYRELDFSHTYDQMSASDYRKSYKNKKLIKTDSNKINWNNSENSNTSSRRNNIKNFNEANEVDQKLNNDDKNCNIYSGKSDKPSIKLFDIHGKIKPWLQRQNLICKIPRECEKSWKAHTGSVSTLKWNVTKFSHLLLSVSMDTTVKIWNVWNRLEPCVRLLNIHSKGIQDGDWNNSGTHILTCSYDKSAVVTDIETGVSTVKCKHRNFVTCGKFHPVNENIFLTGSLDELTAWDTRQGDEPIHRYSYKDKIGQIQDVIFSIDGSEFFSTGDLVSRDSADRNIMAWDFDYAVVKSNQIYQERYSCTCLKMHPTEFNFLAQSHGNYIASFSASRPYKMCKSIRYEGHKLGGYKVGFDMSPDGRYIVSGDSEGKLYCYNYKSGHLIQTLHTQLDVNLNVAFHPLLPSTLACCGWNGFIELWH